MDWLETLFGLSPDGGDGTAEVAIVFACVIVFAAALVVRVPRLRERMGAMFAAWRIR
jgi:hypothetical protein